MKNEVNKESTAYLDEAYDSNKPSLFQVWLHNDDFTPKEFVLTILEKFLYLDRRKATDVMMEAHAKGKAICGVFPKDYAEAKAAQVIEHANENEHPLLLTTEVVY